jgi:hypothetical protein
MRPDQLARLKDIESRMIDVLIEEADPDNWSGAGLRLADMDGDVRGQRFWCKKNAASTIVVLSGVGKLKENTKEALGRDAFNPTQMETQILKAEREASAALARMQERAATK